MAEFVVNLLTMEWNLNELPTLKVLCHGPTEWLIMSQALSLCTESSSSLFYNKSINLTVRMTNVLTFLLSLIQSKNVHHDLLLTVKF